MPNKSSSRNKKRAVDKKKKKTSTSTTSTQNQSPPATTTSRWKTFPLLSLPVGLRRKIFRIALGDKNVVHVASKRPYIKEPALTAVNRQVRSETLPIWYGATVFEIYEPTARVTGPQETRAILQALRDDQLRMIQYLYIVTPTALEAPIMIRMQLESVIRTGEPRGLSKDAVYFRTNRGEWINYTEVRHRGLLMGAKLCGVVFPWEADYDSDLSEYDDW